MRLVGILLLLAGCGDVECGLVEAREVAGPASNECVRVVARGDARVSKSGADGCAAERSRCVVLMPGETGACWEPPLASGASATRETTLLTEHGGCPLVCE